MLSDGDCVTGTAWVHHRAPHDSTYRPHTMALTTPAASDRLLLGQQFPTCDPRLASSGDLHKLVKARLFEVSATPRQKVHGPRIAVLFHHHFVPNQPNLVSLGLPLNETQLK
ncbi:hypothetical protein ROHU_019741 [Labeo rohita]|uniref:Uncharacterized protein n=1 Tax=Labeo rohita TaxID=84645 RepID=A0A498N7S2_LABRO|nr:hypothetical protein ROHU_028745 [Labeo rohita]RXN27732.1 hypothetical protein ROHU_019741 [Labeo rohita]